MEKINYDRLLSRIAVVLEKWHQKRIGRFLSRVVIRVYFYGHSRWPCSKMLRMKKPLSTEIKRRSTASCSTRKVGGHAGIGGSEIGPDGCSQGDHSRAALLKAMAHPVRIRILRLLLESEDSLCSCDIEAHFPLSQPTISHHMKILREASLVESWQDGSWVRYSLPENAPVDVSEILGNE